MRLCKNSILFVIWILCKVLLLVGNVLLGFEVIFLRQRLHWVWIYVFYKWRYLVLCSFLTHLRPHFVLNRWNCIFHASYHVVLGTGIAGLPVGLLSNIEVGVPEIQIRYFNIEREVVIWVFVRIIGIIEEFVFHLNLNN